MITISQESMEKITEKTMETIEKTLTAKSVILFAILTNFFWLECKNIKPSFFSCENCSFSANTMDELILYASVNHFDSNDVTVIETAV